VKSENGQFFQRNLCHMQKKLKPETSCQHPACKRLVEIIGNPSENGPFVNIAWPHKYFPPAGLEVYFSEDWSTGDFDNTGKETTIWRFGRDGYLYGNIYWALLGQGEEEPDIDPKLRPLSEDIQKKSILPNDQHKRLRRTLAEQSKIISDQLHKPILLPEQGEFFLFEAHGKRTYWAWDFGVPPYGEEIYITYTNAKKSDYIGKVNIKRTLLLGACITECEVELNK